MQPMDKSLHPLIARTQNSEDDAQLALGSHLVDPMLHVDAQGRPVRKKSPNKQRSMMTFDHRATNNR